MGVGCLIEVYSAVYDIAVVRNYWEIVYANKYTAISAVIGEAADVLNSLLAAGVVCVILVESAGFNIVKALKVNRRVYGNGINSCLIVHPLLVGGNGEEVFSVGRSFETVIDLQAALTGGINHVSCGDNKDGFFVLILKRDAAVFLLNGGQVPGIKDEAVDVRVCRSFYDDVFFEAGFANNVLQV